MNKLLILLLLLPFATFSQKIEVNPENLELNIGKKVKITPVLVDNAGKKIENVEFLYYSRDARAVSVSPEGEIEALMPGETMLIVMCRLNEERYRLNYLVSVPFPPLKSVSFVDIPSNIYKGNVKKLTTVIKDERGVERENISPEYSSNKPEVASIDAFGNLTANNEGKTTITATVGDISSSADIEIVPSPVTSLTLTSKQLEIRTGDVIHLETSVLDNKGSELKGMDIYYSFTGIADDVSNSASGLIKPDGRFVADIAGNYTITASTGTVSDQLTIRVNPRNIKRKVELIGQGTVSDKHTSDFWVWEGVDGKDYAVTGTWGADGTAYFWDVTNPASLIKIDSIQVDARTVNDVKISEDGKICVISREGASNRKNGIIIIDVTDPHNVEMISTFTENLTGGVHNLFIYENHVYALSAGRKYYSINIEDPKNPKIVGEFELEEAGHSIHDVWVEDGIAYSSNWRDGVQLVDIGNGIADGSPSNPVQFASYTYPSGANHAAFPFKSKSANKFYVIAGDEIFPYGLNFEGPNIAGGFIHFIDFTDLDSPEEIARFEVPGAGSHNFWVKDEILYVAFYNGGVRMVDISGELMGDLFKQGREIGWFIPASKDGYIPNSPFTWGAQPHKGHIFMSDWNSGLWSIKLEPVKPEQVSIEVK